MNWKTIELEKCCDVKSSSFQFKKIPDIDTKNQKLDRVLALKVSDMNTDKNRYIITESKIEFYPDFSKFKSNKCVPRGSIIFPKRGAAIATNKKRLLQVKAILDPNLIAIVPSKVFTSEFLYYYFLTVDLVKLTDPGCLPQLNKKDLQPLKLPLPPLEEQKKIAGVLSLVQEAISQQEKAIALTTELKKALMQKLFTEGTRNEPQKMTAIGLIPESWEFTQLKKFFSIKHGYAFKGEYFKESGEYILMTPGHFFEEGGFKDQGSKTKYYTGEIPQDYLLKERDLLIAMTEQKSGLLGSYAFVPESNKYLHNQRLGLIENLDHNSIDIDFLSHVLNTNIVRKQIAQTATGSKVKHTSPGKILDVWVTIPNI